jgi:hypothetical protein
MGYASKYGRRPQEYASKATHHNIINDKSVTYFLQHCDLPKVAGEVDLNTCEQVTIDETGPNPIRSIIAIDGGYTNVFVRKEFPSSTIAFFQFGALAFTLDDLSEIGRSDFIFPEQMAKLKHIERIKLVLPTRAVTAYEAPTLTASIRTTLHNFFSHEPDDEYLYETLKWFIFHEYSEPLNQWTLARCPLCDARDIVVERSALTARYTTPCTNCGGELFLTDVFRLHEAIDDELGAGGILGYVVVLIEQMIIVNLIRIILDTKPILLKECLLIKDGPLAFFGQTANMYRPMRNLVDWLIRKHDLFLVGAEKSGPFVEHADEISNKIQPGNAIILNNDYIYKYIIPGTADAHRPYGATTYYGSKIIYKTTAGHMYVLTLPTTQVLANPLPADFHNMTSILMNVARLRCDMYDSSLIPVALVNKLVSLADHPSKKLIERFAQAAVKK